MGNMQHVGGINKGHIVMYALSTCVWCKRVKKYLTDLGVEYYYVDVDLKGEEERSIHKAELVKWNPSCSFPTLVINNEKCVVGFDEERIRSALGV